jgi:hypothetical protein
MIKLYLADRIVGMGYMDVSHNQGGVKCVSVGELTAIVVYVNGFEEVIKLDEYDVKVETVTDYPA